MTRSTNHIYEFGECRIDTAERLVLRAGKQVSLTPKAFDTLVVLVQNAGRLVEKDDLIKEVWPDAIVEEANLSRNVYAIRRALGDGGEHTYIETVPKAGYRFVAAVTDVTDRVTDVVATVPGVESPGIDIDRRPWFPIVLSAVLALGVVALVVVRFWPAPIAAPNTTNVAKGKTGFSFLTDGSHDDSGAYWTADGRVFFSRSITTTRTESWTMNAMRQDSIARTGRSGVCWSVDGRLMGKRVLFLKDGVTGTAYLAEADGAHEIALPFVPGNMDWSPDGSRFVYQTTTGRGISEIDLYTLATGKSVTLTKNPAGDADPSFSTDGARIAFTSWRDGNAEIYVMDADGSKVRRITNHPAFDNYPVFSPDDTQIAFQSNRDDEHVEVYLQNLNDSSPPKRLTRSASLTGLAPRSWSADGTRMLVYTNQNGLNQIAAIGIEPSPVELVLKDDAADLGSPRLSRDGKLLLHEARLSDRSLELRLTDLETTHTRRLFKTEPNYPVQFHLTPAWSPDQSLIAFTDRVNGNSEIFTMKADGSELRNLTRNPLLDATPVFTADGREIIFARDTYGRALLYRMDTNGAGQRRVTDAQGYEMSPTVSPDGSHLAFSGDRNLHGLDIFALDLEQPRHERCLVSRRFQETFPAYSPDGTRIAFVANSDGNPEVYVMHADGTGLFRLTHSREEETSPVFTPDGRHIVFSSNRDGKFAIYQVDAR